MSEAIQPIWPNPDDVPNRLWYRGDIYTGVLGSTGRYVPKVNDAVYAYEPDYTIYRVTYVNNEGLSTLEMTDLNENASGVTGEDILLGGAPGQPTEAFRCYINTTKLPFTLALDTALHFYGSTIAKYKVFKGLDIGETGEVISAWYNASGQLVSENIPVELVASDDLNNLAIKAPKVGFASKTLPDGHPVTVVAYDDVGGMVSTSRLLVRNTNFVRSSTAETRYVTGIRLQSPFLSLSDSKVLEYPENVTIDTVHLKGVVSYSDGGSAEWPVDGTKFKLLGMSAYIPTTPGQEQPVTLQYTLSASESTYAGLAQAAGSVMVPYTVRTVVADGAYSVKLFGYPSWINSVSGYRMEWWLYNLERDTYYYATPYVEMATNSAPFQPTQYGVNQEIVVAVNLNSVNPAFREYRHVQAITVTLARRGDILTVPNWTVSFETGQNPPYGQKAVARLQFVNTNQWNLNVASGAASMEQWLREIYFDTRPLFNNDIEELPPTPTHFNAMFKGRTYEMSVNQWDAISVVANDYAQGELLKLQFFKRTATEDLQLGTSCLIVYVE